MTPEMLTALLSGVAALVVAIGVLITKVGDLAKTTRAIEVATNGAASASASELKLLRNQVRSLEERLVESQQAADDVRVALGRESQ